MSESDDKKPLYSMRDFQGFLFMAFALGASLGALTAAVLIMLFRAKEAL